MKLAEIIKLAVENTEKGTMQELADLLGVRFQTIHRWKTEVSMPKIDHAHKLAEIAGLDPAHVITDVLIQGEKIPEVRSTLERLKRSLATAAALFLWLQPGANHAQPTGFSTDNNIHYTHNRRRFRRLAFT